MRDPQLVRCGPVLWGQILALAALLIAILTRQSVRGISLRSMGMQALMLPLSTVFWRVDMQPDGDAANDWVEGGVDLEGDEETWDEQLLERRRQLQGLR